MTLGSNLILKDKRLIIEARKPFFILEQSMSCRNTGFQPIEPEIIGLAQGQNRAFASLCPSGLGGRNDVRTLRHRNEQLVQQIYRYFQDCSAEELLSYAWASFLCHAKSIPELERNHRGEDLSFPA